LLGINCFHAVEPPTGKKFEKVTRPQDIFDKIPLVYRDAENKDNLDFILNQNDFVYHYSLEDSNNPELQLAPQGNPWDYQREELFLQEIFDSFPDNETIVTFFEQEDRSLERNLDPEIDGMSFWWADYNVSFTRNKRTEGAGVQYSGEMELLLEKDAGGFWVINSWYEIPPEKIDSSTAEIVIKGTWGRFRTLLGE